MAVEYDEIGIWSEVKLAIARTHVETGAPITVHTSGPHQTGRIAVRIFTEEGVDLSKVVIGHAGDSNDLDYLTDHIAHFTLAALGVVPPFHEVGEPVGDEAREPRRGGKR